MNALTILFILLPTAGAKPRPDELAADAGKVVAAVVEAGRRNAKLPARTDPGAKPPYRRAGDELTDHYVREAAAAARKLPAGRQAPAFLLGVGVALDTSALARKNPLTGRVWAKVESDKARAERLKVLGLPTAHGRHDLAQHFAVSAALTAVRGARAAEAAGVVKELLDAEEGGSGFSFADLAADLSGVAFAGRLLGEPARLARVEKSFTVADYALGPKGLAEGLSAKEFERRYGSAKDKRFTAAVEGLKKKVRELPGHKDPPKGK